MNANKYISLVCSMGMLMLSVAVGVCGDIIADTTDTADVNGTVTFSYGAPGEITVTFPEQSPLARPEYNAVTIIAGTSSGASTLGGNYIEKGVKSVSFKIQGAATVTAPVELQLVLRSSASGRVWRNSNITASAEGGVLVVNSTSLERSSGWTRNDTGDLDAMWLTDLESVEVIGVRLAQPNRQGMSYTLSSFTLNGDGFILPPSDLSPLALALSIAFAGKTSIAELSDAEQVRDLDGDGMADVVEIRSENDDEYANSIFAAEIVEISDSGILIRWPCVAVSRYTVMRSTSLMDPFADLDGAIALPATYTGYMTHLDATAVGSGPYFYKIRRDKP